MGLLSAAASVLHADDTEPVFGVSAFALQYAVDHPEHPPLAEIANLSVELGLAPTGFTLPTPDAPTETIVLRDLARSADRRFHASALGHVAAKIVAEFNRRGLIGVYVSPHPDDIDLESERDLRPVDDTVLRLVIWTGQVRELRSVAFGERVDSEWKINNAIHARIRKNSPIKPDALKDPEATSLLRKDVLEDYLFRLNRHPARRVDAALAASEDGQGAALDYLVTENKPWFGYAMVSDTGTPSTNVWQQRYGYSHNQLTGRDDILQLEYVNVGFDNVHALSGSYEAPWFSKRRPDWFTTKRDSPDWWNPDAVPWWGSDRMRWRVDASWSRFTAGDVGFAELKFRGEQWSGGFELEYTPYQHKAFFVDVFGGIRLRSIETVGSDPPRLIKEFFALPRAGVRAERTTDVSNLRAEFLVEGEIHENNKSDVNALGRPGFTDSEWATLQWNVSASQYLEPLFDRKSWEDPATPYTSTLAHELAVSFRGQHAFDYRLPPQFQQVAGGLYSVRGYPQSVAVGDSALLATAEYRFHLPRALPVARRPLQLPGLGPFRFAPQQVYGRPDWDLVFRAFFDAGQTGVDERRNALDRSQTLLGAGAGVELQIKSNLRARLDWARALRDVKGGDREVSSGNDEFHVFFTILY
ncbi:MAG: hypothetical protein MJE66_12400 [Proteobacteria bacterium]|nr:hypothetical protein [Pseudomonadota bacterium]